MKINIRKTLILVSLLAMLPLALFSHSDNQTRNKENQISKAQTLQVATFAGGCFWCVESRFEKVEGVASVVSGYSGGSTKNPTYKQVSAGQSDHLEAVQVHYDPATVSYEKLLDAFWREIDPTDNGGQFVDRGKQYRPYVFYHSPQQQEAAEQSRRELQSSGRFSKKINTDIVPFTVFYPAEEYHQNYYSKNPLRYKYYRYHSGRDQFLNQVWSVEMDEKISALDKSTQKYHKPADEVIRKNLTPLQYQVTQQEGTERPFDNTYWDEKREGIYVDVVSGEPLFSSTDKYDSKSGWPSFSRAIDGIKITEKTDQKLFSTRTEVRSYFGDSHLGHVFDDGPAPTGLRYCINSAAMRFIPKAEMEKEGYGEYLALFK